MLSSVLSQPPKAHSFPCLQRRTIWIDLDNTPHVPFFRPIIRELEKRGYHVILTARDAYQVCDLADHYGLYYRKIGRHYGKNPALKLWGLALRALQLAPVALRAKPALALSHGSRSQLLIANLLWIPTVGLMDYEFTKTPPLCQPKWEIVPEVIPTERVRSKRVLKYPGIKEDVYVWDLIPDPHFRHRLGLSEDDLVVAVRPPATEAHYHNREAELLLDAVMDRLLLQQNAKVILLPRSKRQADLFRSLRRSWFDKNCVIIPSRALCGLDLLWHSDLVISGGGTMNREAAALGVPVYSIFRGPTGAIDEQLEREGRLTMLRTENDVLTKLQIRKRNPSISGTHAGRRSLYAILDHLMRILEIHYGT